MPPRVAKVSCTNCRSRHRACNSNRGSEKCAECRTRGLDCDIAQKYAQQQHSTRSVRSRHAKAAVGTNGAQSSYFTDVQPQEALIASQSNLPPRQDTSSEIAQLESGEKVACYGFDFGTRYSAAAHEIASRDSGVRATQIRSQTILFGSADDREVIMEATIVIKDGRITMLVGREVGRALAKRQVAKDDIFTLPKLSLLEGNEEKVLGPLRDYDPQSVLSHKHAKDIVQRHQRALARFRGQEVSVRMRFDDSWHVFTLNAAVDIIEGVAAWMWDRMKCDFRAAHGCSAQQTLNILAKAKIAAAVPETWSETMVDKFRESLIKARFPNVHIVSEAKCAAVVIAHERQRSFQNANEALNTVMIVFDLGAGTLDLTTIQIERFQPDLKIKTLVQSAGSLWGAQQINEIFKSRLPHIIGSSYYDIVDQLSASTGVRNEDLLLEPFVRGFEKAKREYELGSEDDVMVNFDDIRPLPPLFGVQALHNGHLDLPAAEMRSILKEHADNMGRALADQFARLENGNIVKDGMRVELHCVGGGSKSEYIQKHLESCVTKATVMKKKTNEMPTVADGALLIAIDPALGSAEFSRAAFGTVYTVLRSKRGRRRKDPTVQEDVPDCVYWNWGILQRLDGTIVVDGWIEIMLHDIPAGDDETIDLEMNLVKTQNPSLVEDGIQASTEGITRLEPLVMKVRKQDHRFPTMGKGNDRHLRIETRAIPKFEGMRIYFIFVVHRTGTFPNDNLHEYEGHPDYLWERIELHDALEYSALKVEG